MIPNTQDAIRYITMKLDENDRATTTRLMKVKDMLLQQSIENSGSGTRKCWSGSGRLDEIRKAV